VRKASWQPEFCWKKRKSSWKRLCESLNPIVKEIPTKWPETTTSCGLNPIIKGIPTKWPETTTSCGLNPIVKGIPTKKARDNNKL
jgi:hypothetical protein